jgi:hypothetical protein
VGNGEDIRILKDKWIPDMHCLPVIPVVQMPEDLRVSSLMDSEPMQWNEELVRLCFNTTIADSILNIPLCRNRVHNCISIYTVKSAYILAKSEVVHLKASAKGKGEISDQGCTTNEWT